MDRCFRFCDRLFFGCWRGLAICPLYVSDKSIPNNCKLDSMANSFPYPLNIYSSKLLICVYTVYPPKKYAHGFCFAVLCCGYTLTDFPISIRLTSLALWQSNDCPSASKATLMNMDKYFMWIHYERLHNHNKAKHNKTVCIFLGIYCEYRYLEFWFLLISFFIFTIWIASIWLNLPTTNGAWGSGTRSKLYVPFNCNDISKCFQFSSKILF